MHILYIIIVIVILYSKLVKCDQQSASALRQEISNAQQELSDLRKNYSLIQEELKRVRADQVNDGHTMKLGEEDTNSSRSDEFFRSKEFDTLFIKGSDALKVAVQERFQKTLNQTIKRKNDELEEKNDLLEQERTKEDYNRVACAIMLIRWHVVEEFKNNIYYMNPDQYHPSEKNDSISLWTAYIDRGSTKAAAILREALGHDRKSYDNFAFSMIKMYRLCDAYMRTIPEAMRIIDEYKVFLRPVNEMLQLYGTRGPCHQFLKEDMIYVNILLSARGVDGLGWRWMDEESGVVKPEAPMKGCVNPYITEKPLMQ